MCLDYNWDISHFNNSASYCHTYTSIFMYCTLYSCQIVMKLNFRIRFSKNARISNFFKIRPLGAQLFHTDRRKDGQTRRSEQSLFEILWTRLNLSSDEEIQVCLKYDHNWINMPIPVAERSKAWVCSLSPAGIARSNPAGGMDVCLLWLFCVCQVEVSATD